MSNKTLYASRAGFVTTLSAMIVLTYAFIVAVS